MSIPSLEIASRGSGLESEAVRTGHAAFLSRPSDEELLLRYREIGDQDAFDELVHRYEGKLYGYLVHFLGRTDLAEDVFQATFLRLHEKVQAYQEGRPVKPWIYNMATHLAIDALRKAGRRRTISLDAHQPATDDETGGLIELLQDAAPGPLAQLEEQERSAWTRQAIADLPPTLRAVVLLVFQGLKYRDAAKILGIPEGTVKSRLHTALLRLSAAWKRTHRGEE